jgi:hypothetical protein
VAKARCCGDLVLQRVRDAGFDLRDSIVEFLGSGYGAFGIGRPRSDELADIRETVLRVAVETDSRDAAERFARELMPNITAGPQGTTGYAEGRPRVHPVFRYWPCLIGRAAVAPQVEILASRDSAPLNVGPGRPTRLFEGRFSPSARTSTSSVPGRPSCLYDIACARSGDKGTSANIGVIARGSQWWDFLQTWLSADRVADFFNALGIESVERFELPNLQALNFVLRGALRRSLRTDAQGKALGQLLLEMQLPEDLEPKITKGKF